MQSGKRRILFIKPPGFETLRDFFVSAGTAAGIRCNSLRLSVIFDYGIPRRGDPSMWKGALICTNSKNVSYLDCLWGELYGSINNGFLRIFAK